jgi:hypothetical protein
MGRDASSHAEHFAMKAAGLIAALVFAALVPSAWISAQVGTASDEADSQSAAAEEIAPGPAGFQYVGTASCSAANCHGGDGSRPVRMGGDPFSPQAYSVWVASDPHARAYEALYLPVSQQMAKQLELENAHTAPVCLSCHSINATPRELTAESRHTLHDGVGCEACHGAAEKWLDAHKWGAWSALSGQQKRALGYRDVADVVERTRLCAECHVGAEGRDVNHDLIAAGHPRMTFEMSAYHANLPKHWKNESTPADELDARLWLVGQAVAVEASAAQLARRAADEASPWPELSEYDCFACHHDLADPSWRQIEFDAASGLPPGEARWGSWQYPLVNLLQDASAGNAGPALDELRAAMQRVLPDRAAAGEWAAGVQNEFDSLTLAAGAAPLGRGDQLSLIARVADVGAAPALANWDDAAQRFLASAAMAYSLQAGGDGDRGAEREGLARIEEALAQIRALLQFSDDDQAATYNSPRSQSPDRRRAIREAFDEIHEAAAALAPAEP